MAYSADKKPTNQSISLALQCCPAVLPVWDKGGRSHSRQIFAFCSLHRLHAWAIPGMYCGGCGVTHKGGDWLFVCSRGAEEVHSCLGGTTRRSKAGEE